MPEANCKLTQRWPEQRQPIHNLGHIMPWLSSQSPEVEVGLIYDLTVLLKGYVNEQRAH